MTTPMLLGSVTQHGRHVLQYWEGKAPTICHPYQFASKPLASYLDWGGDSAECVAFAFTVCLHFLRIESQARELTATLLEEWVSKLPYDGWSINHVRMSEVIRECQSIYLSQCGVPVQVNVFDAPVQGNQP